MLAEQLRRCKISMEIGNVRSNCITTILCEMVFYVFYVSRSTMQELTRADG